MKNEFILKKNPLFKRVFLEDQTIVRVGWCPCLHNISPHLAAAEICGREAAGHPRCHPQHLLHFWLLTRRPYPHLFFFLVISSPPAFLSSPLKFAGFPSRFYDRTRFARNFRPVGTSYLAVFFWNFTLSKHKCVLLIFSPFQSYFSQ